MYNGCIIGIPNNDSNSWICNNCKFHYVGELKECNKCTMSNGEKLVAIVLDTLGIKYENEWINPKLTRRKYDFYFENNGVKHIIEFDGNQHFTVVEKFHTSDKDLEKQQRIDRIKTHVALQSKIRVLRISYLYKDFKSIHELIKEFLNSNWKLQCNPESHYEYLCNGYLLRSDLWLVKQELAV
jgi:hypothetical protein